MGRYLSARLVQGAIVDHRRQRARVRRHPDDRRSGQLHPAAVGVAGAARRAPRESRLRPARSSRQFGSFAADAIRLDFGDSTYFRNEAALDIVMRFLPKTLQLVVAGMSIAFFASIPLGAICRPASGTPARQDARHAQPHRSGDPAVLPRPGDPADHEREVQPRPVRRRAVDPPDLPGDHAGAAGDRPADDGRALGDDRRAEQPVRQGGQGQGSQPRCASSACTPCATRRSRSSRCSAGR